MILLLVHILLVITILHKMPLFRNSGIITPYWAVLLALKVIVGYALIVYYDARYEGSDMRGYLEGAETVYRIFLENPMEGIRLFTGFTLSPGTINRLNEQVPIWFGRPCSGWFNDTRTVIKIQSVLRFVSDGNIWIHLLWTNLAALVGGIALIRFFIPLAQKETIPLPAICLLFIPNGLLWASTILKEPFLLLAIGITLSAYRNCLISGFTSYQWPLFLSLLLFLVIKPFWLMALVPGLVAWGLYRQRSHASLAVAGSYLIVLLLAMAAGIISPDLHLPSLLFGEQRNMWRFSIFGGAGSLIDPVGFAPTWISVFKHIPETFLLTMSQPVPSGWNDWAGWFLFTENILFSILLLMVILRRGSLGRIWSSPSLLLACLAGIIIVLVSGFTTPVAGTLIRYRWPGVLLILLALFTAWLNGRSGSIPDAVDKRAD